MTFWRMLLGTFGALTLCGSAMSKPPSGPLSEGRELDPIVRDFYLDAPPADESRGPTRSPEKPGDLFGESLLTPLRAALMNWSTIQLSPFRLSEMR